MKPSLLSQVGVVIIHYHRPEDVSGLVDDLLDNKRMEPQQIVVVDNSSIPEALERVTRREVNVHPLPNVGYGAAVNAGTSILSNAFSYVLVLTHEVSLDDDTILELAEFLEGHPECGQVGPLLMRSDRDGEIWSAGGMLSRIRRAPNNSLMGYKGPTPYMAREVAWLDGAVFLVRRSDLVQMGGFAEMFFLYFEDVDFGWKIRTILDKRVICLTSVRAFQQPGVGLSHFLATRNMLWTHLRQKQFAAWGISVTEQVVRLIVGSILKPKGALTRQKQRLRGLLAGLSLPSQLREPRRDHVFFE